MTKAAASLNAALHELMGVEPCSTGCTHVVSGKWTALGIANVCGRVERSRVRELCTSEGFKDGIPGTCLRWRGHTGRHVFR